MRSLYVTGLVVASLLAADTVWAQTGSLFNNSGRSNSSSSSRAGNSSRSGSNQSNAALSNSEMLGAGGLTNVVGGIDVTNMNSDGFVGRSSQEFVGNQAASGTTAGRSNSRNSSLTRRQTTTRRNTSTLNNTNRQLGRNGQTTGSSTIRIRQRVAFDHTSIAAPAIESSVRSRFQKIATSRPEFRGVEVDVDASGEVILRGEVPDEETGALIAAMVRLEPAVRSVRSELTVQGGSSASLDELPNQ